jgi:hypothetical protein
MSLGFPSRRRERYKHRIYVNTNLYASLIRPTLPKRETYPLHIFLIVNRIIFSVPKPYIKGIVQQKPRWVESGINRQVLFYCSVRVLDIFIYFKGPASWIL